jgi:hypothetical protein
MGRFGQVFAPLLASALVAASWSNVQLFLIVGLAPLCGALAILVLTASGDNARAAKAAGITPSLR